MQVNISIKSILKGHSEGIYCLSKGFDRNILFSGSADKFVGAWEIATGVFKQPVAKVNDAIYALHYHDPLNNLFIGTRSGNLYLVDTNGGLALRNIAFHQKPIFDIAINTDKNELYLLSGDGSFSVWNLSDLELKKHIKLSNENGRSLSLSEDNAQLAIGLSDNSIRIFDTNNLEQIDYLIGHENSVFTVAFCGNKLLSGSRDAHLYIWEKQGEKYEIKLKIPAHNFTINHICIHPTLPIFATASRDKTIKIWDKDNFQLLKVIDRNKFEESHTHSINKLLWINQNTLISAGDDKKIIVWDFFLSN